MSNLRIAVRQLTRRPGLATTIVLTLALGIGANGAIFALVDATLLRPLPLPEPERLVTLWESTATTQRASVSPLNLADWAERSRAFESMAGYEGRVGGMVLPNADGTTRNVPRQWVTTGIFDVLGIDAIAGRTFTVEDAEAGGNAVVLSESFWKNRFNADPGIVGGALRLDGELYTVVGVVPDKAQLIGDASIWALLGIVDPPPEARAAHFLRVIGRLEPGVTLRSAAAEMALVAEALAREFPATNQGRDVFLEPLHDFVVGSDLRITALLFLGVVGLVLLICCANVANLLLARATERSRELAIRGALGANRWRVVRQMLTETLLLATLGCALGLVLGAVILRIFPSVVPDGLLPGAIAPTFDLHVVGFCVAAATLVAVVVGLAPVWYATRLSPSQAMRSETRGTTGRRGKLRGVLVIAEVATAVVVLVAGGLLLRTLLEMETADRGYRAEGALTLLVDPLGDRYPTPESLLRFFGEIEREVGAIPGVREVAWSSSLPLGTPSWQTSFNVVGTPPVPGSERPIADYQIISASYLAALDVAVMKGRGFDDGDRGDNVPVGIVNEAFVRTYLRGISPIGARIAVRASTAADAPATVREIVGVTGQVKARAAETEGVPKLYVPLAQDPVDDLYLIVRTRPGNAAALTNSVRAAIGHVDAAQLVGVREIMSLPNIARDATSRHRFRAVLVATFAALALLLAMIGVFGILAYSVQQRTRNFGVRMAMGATANDVMRLVIRGSASLVAAGAAIGFVLAILMTQWLSSMLYQVEPLDPLTFVGVAVVLTVAAALAALGPARRATRVDPIAALREE